MHAAPAAGRPCLDELIESAWSDLREIVVREVRRRGDSANRHHETSILDEAMVRLLTQRSAIVDPSHLRGLVTIFVRRILADRRRRSRRYRRLLREAEGPRDRFAGPGRPGELLSEALASLQRHDERKFMTIVLSAMDRLPQDVIASVLGTSLATVERDLRYSRAWIAARLDEPSHDRIASGRRELPERP